MRWWRRVVRVPQRRRSAVLLALACLVLALELSLLYWATAVTSGLTSDDPLAGLFRWTPPAHDDGNATAQGTTYRQQQQVEGVLTGALYVAGHDVVGDLDIVCPHRGKGLLLLIAVASAPAHREARQAVRQTWGNVSQRGDVALAFVLGATATEHRDDGHLTELETSLVVEAATHGDLIRGRFLDTYDNLTLKTVSTLEWVERHCPSVGFVLKTDDDMFINMHRLVSFIGEQQQQRVPAAATTKNTRKIFGRLARRWRPVRYPWYKNFVPAKLYARPVLPDFMTGPAYLVSGDAVSDLYGEALRCTFLKLEDVFVTGIVADAVNVSRVLVEEFLNARIDLEDLCRVRAAISIHEVKPREQYGVWERMRNGGGTDCRR